MLIFSLNLILAIFLNLLGQAILLVPTWFQGIFLLIPSIIRYLSGFGLLFISFGLAYCALGFKSHWWRIRAGQNLITLIKPKDTWITVAIAVCYSILVVSIAVLIDQDEPAFLVIAAQLNALFVRIILLSLSSVLGLILALVVSNHIELNTNLAGLQLLFEVENPAEIETLQNFLKKRTGPFPAVSSAINRLVQKIQYSQIEVSAHVNTERKIRTQLDNLRDLSNNLQNTLDPPVAAQLAAAALQRTFNCSLVCILIHVSEDQRLAPIAIVGYDVSMIPLGYRFSIRTGMIGRAVAQQKTLLYNLEDNQGIPQLSIVDHKYLSAIACPLIRNGYLEGMLLLADYRPFIFEIDDLSLIEATGAQVITALERYRTSNCLTELIQSSVALSSVRNFEGIMEQIAEISRRVLQAHFTVAAIQNQGELVMSAFGKAPGLLNSLKSEKSSLILDFLKAPGPIRIRDIRKDSHGASLLLDIPELRNVLACPILLHREPIGVIIAFGRKGGLSFSEQDAFLLELLSSQVSAAIESNRLNQELFDSLERTQLLHNLSMQIVQAENLNQATQAIGEAAFQLCKASTGGIILFNSDGKLEVEKIFPANQNDHSHPQNLINLVMKTKQIQYSEGEQGQTLVCFPLFTMRRSYGCMWLKFEKDQSNSEKFAEELRILLNQAAVALERSVLMNETFQQAQAISQAYEQLEQTYDQTLIALMSFLDARDREIEGHSLRVARLATSLGVEMQLNDKELKSLERGALLHDIGKIGISDDILKKTGPLHKEEREIIEQHPSMGAQILQSVPFLADAIPVIACHQERWNGSGYPYHLSGTTIPLLARIFAVADVYDALTSDRPYRVKVSPSQALQYLDSKAGIEFDPDVVKILNLIIRREILLDPEEN